MDEYDGTPLTGLRDAEMCEGAPHFYLVSGDPEGELTVVPYSAQHCCMDHSDFLCYGWVCLEMKHLGEKEWPTPDPFAQVEESPHQTQ